MLERLRQLAHRRGQALHGAQGGAIILLVLAAFLILTLASLTMFDAGQTAQEEIQVQTAADSAAYSQSVVKARSMNKITYANTAKRMFFGYFVTYVSGVIALGISTGIYCGQCAASYGLNFYACQRCGVGLGQQGAELTNFYKNVRDVDSRATNEIKALDNFQEYLAEITPWWAYVENFLRGHYNGATATASWPPPPATLPSAYNALVTQVMNFDDLFTTNISAYLPDPTEIEDRMPVQRRGGSLTVELADYCAEFYASPEHILPAAEHVIRSDGGGLNIDGISRDGQTLGIFAAWNLFPGTAAATCAFVLTNPLPSWFPYSVLGNDVMRAALDWRVDDGGWAPDELEENEWMQRTSNITLAYKNAERSSDRRNKFEGILNDHDERPSFRTDGTWSLARSEIVWGESAEMSAITDLLPGVGGILSGIDIGNFLGGPLVGARGGPHMWAPRWTGRLRPVYIPGEELGPGQSQIAGDPIGLGHVFIDSLPHMAITATVSSLVSGNFDFFNAVEDMYYMYVASSGFSADLLEGLDR